MLRWADPSILLKVYAHWSMDKRREAQAKMTEVMGLSEKTVQGLAELALVGFTRMMDYISIQRRDAFIDLSQLDSEQSAAISELTSDVLLQAGETGDSNPVKIRRTKIKLGGKMEALKTLAHYNKLLTGKHDRPTEDGGLIVVWVGDAKEKRQREQKSS